MGSLLQINAPLEFFKEVSDGQDELLDFGEDFEPVQKFFSPNSEQEQIFRRALDMLGIYDDSKTYIVNAELEGSDLSSTLTAVEVLNEVTSAVEQELGITLDRESYNYARFAMHIQFLVRRLSAGVAMEQGSGKMLDELSLEYPAVYHCACTVAQNIEQRHGWHCSRDEVLYLMLHIYRVQNCESN